MESRNNMQPPQGDLMTAQEAIQAFIQAGSSEPTFRRRVRAGQIESILPEGRQRGAMYPKKQVIAALNREKRSKRDTKPKETNLKGATFIKMKPEDMVKVAPVIYEIFDTYPDIERWSSLIAKNPDTGYMLVSEEKVVGCGFMIPLIEQKILDILSKEVTPPTTADEVQEYRPKEQYYLYVRTIGVIQKSVATAQKRFWAGILVRNLMKTFVALGSRGIVVKKVYGRSDTVEGLRLMHDMGFTQVRTTTSHKNFLIDVGTSGIEMVLRY